MTGIIARSMPLAAFRNMARRSVANLLADAGKACLGVSEHEKMVVRVFPIATK
ncbi:MAG: hypothetical protein JO356_07175 [Acidobacteria bacterium]|nr:hypothetical protein [Acidobacteriota bacterium]